MRGKDVREREDIVKEKREMERKKIEKSYTENEKKNKKPKKEE